MNTSMIASQTTAFRNVSSVTRCSVVHRPITPAQPSMRSSKAQSRQKAIRTVKATANEGVDVDQIVSNLQEKWDKVENKTTVLVYAGGSIIALWLSSSIVGAVNAVPLLPKLLELVGLGYTSWFIYRYLLFKNNRQELLDDIEELKKKISGASQDTADTINAKADQAKSKTGL